MQQGSRSVQGILASAGKDMVQAVMEKGLDVLATTYGALMEEMHGRIVLQPPPAPNQPAVDPATQSPMTGLIPTLQRVHNYLTAVTQLYAVPKSDEAQRDMEQLVTAAMRYEELYQNTLLFLSKLNAKQAQPEDLVVMLELCREIDPTCLAELSPGEQPSTEGAPKGAASKKAPRAKKPSRRRTSTRKQG